MEYVPGGDLYQVLSRERGFRFDASRSRRIASQLVCALSYLQEECWNDYSIVHRDIKPENILIGANYLAKLADFGFAKMVRKKGGRCYSFVGTPEYLAPEVIAARHNGKGAGTSKDEPDSSYRYSYDKGVDWWGLGALVFEMLHGRAPFYSSLGRMGMYQRILSGELRFDQNVEPDARSFVSELLITEPEFRLGNRARGSKDVKEHEWLASALAWDL